MQGRSQQVQVQGTVIAVSQSPRHTMSKPNQEVIELSAGLGVTGDAHAGRRRES